MFRFASIAIVLGLLGQVASASDGVLEINQACATSSIGCFPGDAGGFPVTITQQGSYRLTGNLSVPLNTTAIQINATVVTLDLGGFVVSGPNACTGYPTTSCTVTAGNPGIESSQFLVVVRNGSVVGMGGEGIFLSGVSSEVDAVRVLGCGNSGIFVGPAGRVTHSFSGNNLSHGINLGDGGTADDDEVRANQDQGIIAGGARLNGSVTRVRAFDNGQDGILALVTTLISKNVAVNNGQIQISGGRSLSDNLCNGTLC